MDALSFQDKIRSAVSALEAPSASASAAIGQRGARLGVKQDLAITRPDYLVLPPRNYCAIQKSCSWGLYQHRVDFTPIEDNDKVRKALARLLEDDFIGAAYIFDGKPGQSGLPEGSP